MIAAPWAEPWGEVFERGLGANYAAAHRICALGGLFRLAVPVARGSRPVGGPEPAAATARPFYEHRTMSIETWTAERIEQLRHCVASGLTCSQTAAEIGVTRNAVIGKIHRLGLSPARPAGAPARSCPPRARHPRISPSSRLLRLIGAQAPGIAADDDRRAGADRQRAALLAARDRARQVPLADRRSACRGFCLLRQCGGHRLFILRRSRPHGLSGSGATARLTRADRTAPLHHRLQPIKAARRQRRYRHRPSCDFCALARLRSQSLP